MLRGTNNGVTAIIDHRGQIQARGPQFEEITVSGEVQPRTGLTPVVKTGSWPILLMCALILLVFLARDRRLLPRSGTSD